MGKSPGSKEDIQDFLDAEGEVVANCAHDSKRMAMYLWMQRDANLAKLWRIDPDDVANARQWRLPRNVYENRLPPTYVMHGDADTGVGVEQSDELVGAMLGCGLEVVYERPHDKDHFLDAGEDYENDVFWAFVLKHLN
jgi:dipeptidyl aminopeptidase/acylaminoacyl peptidase